MKRILIEAGKLTFAKVVAQIIPGLIAVILIFFAWDWLMPDLFGTKEISFGQAIAMLVLSQLLLQDL